MPRGFGIEYKGESRQFVNEGSSLMVTFALAIIVIFLVLAAQFESCARSARHHGLGAAGHHPARCCRSPSGLMTLNIYSQVGLITLVGLITKHGILICEVAKEQQEKEGVDRRQAVLEAASQRLRPILMTTAAMVAGLIPLLNASGAGAASRFAIGVVIVCGLAIGTLVHAVRAAGALHLHRLGSPQGRDPPCEAAAGHRGASMMVVRPSDGQHRRSIGFCPCHVRCPEAS